MGRRSAGSSNHCRRLALCPQPSSRPHLTFRPEAVVFPMLLVLRSVFVGRGIPRTRCTRTVVAKTCRDCLLGDDPSSRPFRPYFCTFLISMCLSLPVCPSNGVPGEATTASHSHHRRTCHFNETATRPTNKSSQILRGLAGLTTGSWGARSVCFRRQAISATMTLRLPMGGFQL